MMINMGSYGFREILDHRKHREVHLWTLEKMTVQREVLVIKNFLIQNHSKYHNVGYFLEKCDAYLSYSYVFESAVLTTQSWS